jgi:chromosomal replication initiation ATPase DnaA
MWLVRRRGDLTLREIGSLFGGIDYAAVSQRIRRVKLGCIAKNICLRHAKS